MWVKKGKVDASKKKRKVSYKGAILVFSLTVIIGVISLKTGHTKFYNDKTVGWLELLSLLPIVVIKAFIYAFIMHMIQLLVGRDFLKSQTSTVVCDRCNKKKLNDRNCECECGGKFISLDEMEWKEE